MRSSVTRCSDIPGHRTGGVWPWAERQEMAAAPARDRHRPAPERAQEMAGK
jgi:hypothetical protein